MIRRAGDDGALANVRFARGVSVAAVIATAALAACDRDGRMLDRPGDAGAGDVATVGTGGGGAEDRPQTPDGPGAATTDGGMPDLLDAVPPVRLVVTPTSASLVAGAAGGTLQVSLDRAPSQPITVTVVSADPNLVTVSPESLLFPAGDVGPMLIELAAPLNNDTTDNVTTIVLASQETGSISVPVAVFEREDPALLVSPYRLSITEGSSDALSVRLSRRPDGDVLVSVMSSSPKLIVENPSLTFTATNYSTPQVVRLTSILDVDSLSDYVTVRIESAASNLLSVFVAVEIIDVTGLNLNVMPSSLSLGEGNSQPGIVSVSLAGGVPPGDVTVAVASSNPAKVAVTPSALTFTPENASTPQRVEVSPVSDVDGRDETATITFTPADLPAFPPRAVSVIVSDPDDPGMVVIPPVLSLQEGGSGSFNVRLTGLGDPETVVNVLSQNPAKVTVSPAVLLFDQTTFSVPQTVTVTSLPDDDAVTDTVIISLVARGVFPANASVTVIDTTDPAQR